MCEEVGHVNVRIVLCPGCLASSAPGRKAKRDQRLIGFVATLEMAMVKLEKKTKPTTIQAVHDEVALVRKVLKLMADPSGDL